MISELRPYQSQKVEEAYPILTQRGMVYLALETRTGKTAIALTLAKMVGLPVLFVTKKKAIPSIESDHKDLNYGLDLTVINYEMLHTITKAHRLVILDEAHTLGGFPKPGVRAKQVRKLTDKCPVILLSATPTPESLSQIYHQLWAANAHLAFIYEHKNFYSWAHAFVDIKQRRIGTGQMVNDYSCAKESLIQPEIDKVMLTLTQEEAGFRFTTQYENIINVHVPDWIVEKYRQIKKDGVAIIRGRRIVADTAASRLSKLHQLCGGTVLDEDDNIVVVSAQKAIEARKLLDKYGKLAIYYKFRGEGQLLRSVFIKELHETWQEFQDAESGVFIAQFRSAAEGINLSTARAILFYTLDYAYLAYEQTRNRIQQYNMQGRGILYFLFSDLGLEKEIREIVESKKNYTSVHFKKLERRIV